MSALSMPLDELRRARYVRAAAPWLRRVADAVRVRRRARGVVDGFDAAYGVRTLVAPGLVEIYRTARHGGFEYEPSPPPRFREVMRALDVRFDETVFVDYGSGAGRAVLLASELPFKEVVGVELSPALHAQAEANVRAFPAAARRAAAVRLVCGEATTFALPPEPAVLYFYNPFGAGVMRRVLCNVEASLAERPRPMTLILAYCYKNIVELVERSAVFRVISAERGVMMLRSRVGPFTPALDRWTASRTDRSR